MPRGDGTGPEGRGPKTGRQAGYCSGSDEPGHANNEVPRQHLAQRGKQGRGRNQKSGRGQGRKFNN